MILTYIGRQVGQVLVDLVDDILSGLSAQDLLNHVLPGVLGQRAPKNKAKAVT